MNIMKLTRVLAGTAVVGLVLAGCGGTPESVPAFSDQSAEPSAAQTGHNDTDVTFANGMAEHHIQAVQMAELAPERTKNARLLDLAARIKAAQGPEIETMSAWLDEWGAEMTSGGMEGMDHSGTGMAGMGGMMSPEQMTGLDRATGVEFDRMFLELMTVHHRGAVEMAQTELRDGSDPRATGLAQAIVDTQQAEIIEMEELLAQL